METKTLTFDTHEEHTLLAALDALAEASTYSNPRDAEIAVELAYRVRTGGRNVRVEWPNVRIT